MTKIVYNIEKKNDIIRDLNICLDELNAINDIFYNMKIPYDFKYKKILLGMQDQLYKDKLGLNSYKDDIVCFMNRLNKNELEILSNINTINETIVNKH